MIHVCSSELYSITSDLGMLFTRDACNGVSACNNGFDWLNSNKHIAVFHTEAYRWAQKSAFLVGLKLILVALKINFSGTKNNFSGTKINISGTKINFSRTKNIFSGTKIIFSPTDIIFSGTKIIFSGTNIIFSPTKNTDF